MKVMLRYEERRIVMIDINLILVIFGYISAIVGNIVIKDKYYLIYSIVILIVITWLYCMSLV